MKIKLIAVILAFLLLLSACSSAVADDAPTGGYSFEDDLGRTVTVSDPQRVAIASGSLAECWLLAGGPVCAVTQDAFTERDLELPETVTDLGSLKEPSLEVILELQPDLLILMASYETHLSMTETLDQARIPYACFDIEDFPDYLRVLRIFTDITGRLDLYESNGTAIQPRIDAAIASRVEQASPTVLVLRASSSRVKVLDSTSMTGGMLRELGCTNIADSTSGILTDLSLEAIVEADPDFIFVVCMGDEAEAMAQLESSLISNPIWATLRAVQSGRFHYLQKELFHYKPNGRWGESYEVLAALLAAAEESE